MIEDDAWEYPIGGPCGWMWRRAKEKKLAQDFNPNHLPTGSPDSTGGRFTTEENASLSVLPSVKVTEKQNPPKSDMPKKEESDQSYLKDAIYPAPEPFDFLPIPSTASLKILKGLKLAYGFSEETMAFLAKFFAEEEAKKALAGAPKNVLKEEKTLSNLFEKKGKASSSKEHVNKYADKSKANPQTSVEKAKLEREALSQIDLRLPKPSKELFDEYEKEGHLLERHLIEGNAHNPTGMTDVHLIQRAQTGKSASAIQNMETLIESYAKALNKPENQERLRRLLGGFDNKVWLNMDMGRKIGRYVKQGSSVVKDAKKVQFLIKRTKNNPEGFYVETLKLL